MAKKGNNEMPETNEFKIPVLITQTAMKPKQKVTDLETGDEAAEIEVKYTKFEAPLYDEKKYGGTKELFTAELLRQALALVSPEEQQIDALVYRATQTAYQAGKAAALATGNYLTSDLRSKIVQVMRGNQAFVDVPASDCFNRWKAGFKLQKPGALKILETAKALGGDEDLGL